MILRTRQDGRAVAVIGASINGTVVAHDGGVVDGTSDFDVTIGPGTQHLAVWLGYRAPSNEAAFVFFDPAGLNLGSAISHGSNVAPLTGMWHLIRPTSGLLPVGTFTVRAQVFGGSGIIRLGAVAVPIGTSPRTPVGTGPISAASLSSTLRKGTLFLTGLVADSGDSTTIALTSGRELANFIGAPGEGASSVRVGAAYAYGRGTTPSVVAWDVSGSPSQMFHQAFTFPPTT